MADDLFGGPQPDEVSRQQKVAALQRELGMRRRVYKRQVEQGRMTQDQADREILIFQSILADYQQ